MDSPLVFLALACLLYAGWSVVGADEEISCPADGRNCTGGSCCSLGCCVDVPNAVCCNTTNGRSCCPQGAKCFGSSYCLDNSTVKPPGTFCPSITHYKGCSDAQVKQWMSEAAVYACNPQHYIHADVAQLWANLHAIYMTIKLKRYYHNFHFVDDYFYFYKNVAQSGHSDDLCQAFTEYFAITVIPFPAHKGLEDGAMEKETTETQSTESINVDMAEFQPKPVDGRIRRIRIRGLNKLCPPENLRVSVMAIRDSYTHGMAVVANEARRNLTGDWLVTATNRLLDDGHHFLVAEANYQDSPLFCRLIVQYIFDIAHPKVADWIEVLSVKKR